MFKLNKPIAGRNGWFLNLNRLQSVAGFVNRDLNKGGRAGQRQNENRVPGQGCREVKKGDKKSHPDAGAPRTI